MAFDLRQNFVSAQYFENNLTDFHQILFVHSYWQDLAWDCYTSFFAHLYENFISAQYLENNSTDFHQILFVHSYWQDLAWDCYMSFFPHLYQSYGSWFMPKFCFRSLSQEHVDWFSPNCMYAFILTRSSLGLMHVIIQTFVIELWPLIYAKILFLFNILRTNGLNFTKLHITINTDKIYVGIDSCHFSQNLLESYGPWLMSELRYHSISWETLAFYCIQNTAEGL